MFITFEDQLFTESDAAELLSEQDINLREIFEIVENKSISGIGDYYHTFTLKISRDDKEAIIEQIKSSPDFKGLNDIKDDLLHSTDRYTGSKLVQSYEDEVQLVREYFEPNGQGYAPTYRKVEVSKKEDTLTFEDIDE
ncbi:hypothetical protein [Hymenobacter cavernae]|uniref:hypothetical protein n=1 Tax=Hymenobacter cavernae TaxID=2044852 RepID=UPI001E4EADFE|nr:hypothetical protein [Hymenobacter cavernae]